MWSSFIKRATDNMSEQLFSEKGKHADSIIRNHVIWSMGAGFIPVAIADIFAVSALQLDMVRQLCKVYDIDFRETQGKALITALTGSTLARAGASAIKLIPGLGSVLGGVSMALLAGASTYALGEVFKTHFSSGGTFLDFDPARMKKFYQDKFEKGKKVAQDLKQQQAREAEAAQAAESQMQPPTPKAASSDLLAKIRELGELKDAGLLTEAEFQAMKKRLIEG